jgi:hypothetical protein
MRTLIATALIALAPTLALATPRPEAGGFRVDPAKTAANKAALEAERSARFAPLREEEAEAQKAFETGEGLRAPKEDPAEMPKKKGGALPSLPPAGQKGPAIDLSGMPDLG